MHVKLSVLPVVCVAEIHRDFLHRPPSGYLPEEIWRKAGKSQDSPFCFTVFISDLAQTDKNKHVHKQSPSSVFGAFTQATETDRTEALLPYRSIRAEDWRLVLCH